VTIVDGIKIGRSIFVNTFNYLKITLASSIGNFFSIAIISLFIPFLPLLPLQILLVNLLADSPMIAISTDNVNPVELARPTSYNLRYLVYFVLFFGVINSIFDFVFFFNFYDLSRPAFMQTNWFMFNIFTAVLFIFSGRTKMLFMKAIRPSYYLLFFSLIAILLSVIIPFTKTGHEIFSFVNPVYKSLGIIFGIGLAFFFACEIFKLFYYRFVAPNNNHE
jgi:Cation transport ATPase